MTGDIFIDYSEYCDNLRNRVMQLHLKFERIKGIAKADFKEGIISEEEYLKISNMRFGESIEGVSDKYKFTLKEIEFINKYADLSLNGNATSSLIRDEFNRKEKTLSLIKDSIIKFDFFANLPFEEQKYFFRRIVEDDLTQKINDYNSEIEKIRKIMGNKYQDSYMYKEFVQNFKKNSSSNVSLGDIDKADANELNSLISRYYGIDYKYYIWFKFMSYKEEYEKGFIYEEHIDVLTGIERYVQDVKFLNHEAVDLNKKLKDLVDGMNQFILAFSTFTFDYVDNNVSKKNGFFNRFTKVEFSNKETLFELFKELSKLPGANLFIESIKTKVMELFDVFNCYFIRYYGNAIDYVDINSFKQRFFKEVIGFYSNKINIISDLLNGQLSRINTVDGVLNNEVDKALSQSLLLKEIYDNYDFSRNYKLDKFSKEESVNIYESMKAYLVKEKENSLKKV